MLGTLSRVVQGDRAVAIGPVCGFCHRLISSREEPGCSFRPRHLGTRSWCPVSDDATCPQEGVASRRRHVEREPCDAERAAVGDTDPLLAPQGRWLLAHRRGRCIQVMVGIGAEIRRGQRRASTCAARGDRFAPSLPLVLQGVLQRPDRLLGDADAACRSARRVQVLRSLAR